MLLIFFYDTIFEVLSLSLESVDIGRNFKIVPKLLGKVCSMKIDTRIAADFSNSLIHELTWKFLHFDRYSFFVGGGGGDKKQGNFLHSF